MSSGPIGGGGAGGRKRRGTSGEVGLPSWTKSARRSRSSMSAASASPAAPALCSHRFCRMSAASTRRSCVHQAGRDQARAVRAGSGAGAGSWGRAQTSTWSAGESWSGLYPSDSIRSSRRTRGQSKKRASSARSARSFSVSPGRLFLPRRFARSILNESASRSMKRRPWWSYEAPGTGPSSSRMRLK